MNSSPKRAAGKAVAAFFFLFGLPFAGFGLYAYSQAFRLIGAPAGSQNFWYPFMFGTIFSGIGLGFMFLAIAGNRKYSRLLRLQAEHPAEPWLWRDDWAAGQVKSDAKGSMVLAWVFAILWNLISWTVTIFALPNALRDKGANSYFLLIFPAAGIILLIYAIRKTIAFAEFGKTCFEMGSVPGVIGRDLKGCVQARFPHSPDHGVQLRLSCVHRYVSGSGNTATSNEQILWRDEADLSPGQLCASPVGTTIPVSFHIPLDAQPTDNRTSRDQVVRQLEAIAKVPGVDYYDIFEIPVFRTAQTPTFEEEEQAQRAASEFRAPEMSHPEHATIRVQPVARGTEFYFPPARNKGLAAFITLFAVIFSAIGYFLMHSRAPIIFPIAFGGVGLLVGYFALQMWLATTRVIIGSSLHFQSGILGGGKVREINLSDIASITDRVGAQSGNGTGTPYYDIELNLTDGRKFTLGRSLRDKHEVELFVFSGCGAGRKRFDAPLRVNVYQAVQSDLYALSYEEYWEGFRRLLAETDVIAIGEPLVRAMVGLPPLKGGCGVSTVRVTPRATTQPCVYWPGSGNPLSDLISAKADILNSAPFEQVRAVPEACRPCEFRESCHGGCAGRRRLQGALLQPDFYCPIIRGERPHLAIRMAADRDLPKLGSSCTTVVIAR